MKKTNKIKNLIISLALFMAFSINAFAYESFDIFSKEPKELTLEEATKYMLEESEGAKEAEINKRLANNFIAVRSNEIEGLEKLGSINDPNFVFSSSYDGLDKVLTKMRKDFAETQKKNNYQAEINKLKYTLRKKYFTTLQAKAAYEIKKEALEISKSSLAELEKKFELGLINELELEQGKIAREDAEIGMIDSQKAFNLSKMDLNNYMGYDIYTNVVLLDKLEEIESSKKTVEETAKLAVENNNLLKGIRFARELQSRRLEGLKLRISMSSTTYKSAELDVALKNKQERQLLTGLKMQSNEKYMTMLINKYYVELARKELEYAKKQSEAAKLSYDLGIGVYLDVKKANTNLEAKKLELSSKILAYNLSVDDYELLSTVGTETAIF